LTWSASAHETGYIAYDSVNNSAWKEIGRPGANQTSLVASGLSPGAYRFIVVAYNNNASALSQTVSATLVAPPIAPTLATPHVASSSEIDLSWSGGSGASNYQIYCSAPGTSWSNTHVVSSSVHQYSITNLSPGFTYSFRVVATTSIAASPSSNSVLATTLPGSANLAGPAVKSSTEIDLSWSPATGAAGYQVMEQGPNGMWGYAGGQLTAGKTSLNVTSLTPGTSYSFIVRAVNSSGGFTSSQTVTGPRTAIRTGAGRPERMSPARWRWSIPSAAVTFSTTSHRGQRVRPCSRSRRVPMLTPATAASSRWVRPRLVR